MRYEKFRETIGGIEVVDAEKADQVLDMLARLNSLRNACGCSKYAVLCASGLFGPGSDEVRLWRKQNEEDRKEYRKAWKWARRLMAEVSNTDEE